MNIADKVNQIFEYLLAVKNLSQKVIRNIDEYEEVLYKKDIPDYKGCYFSGNGIYKDAWFEVYKQDDIPHSPVLPKKLKGWIAYFDDPSRFPEIKEKCTEKFEDDEDRVKIYESWIQDVWKPWSRTALPERKIQKLYNEYFSLYQRFQREENSIELMCGHGMLNWNVNGKIIKRPLLVTPLELKFDAERGIFFMMPTSRGTFMETDMLSGIDVPYIKKLQCIMQKIQDMDIDVLHEESIKPVLMEILNIISPEGRYEEDAADLKKCTQPVITYSPVIFLRKVSGMIWCEDIKKCIQKIKEGNPIPETIKLLVSEGSDDGTQADKDVNDNNEWKDIGENLLFPLPSNEEQKLIAKKLAVSPGVVVQGPPGTGKSHTIANLICHLLSHGKRVLVTSEKERPLKVLRDKIPDEIRPLCVALLGGDSDSMNDVENSIKNIAEGMDSYDESMLKKDVQSLKDELYESKRKISKIKNMLDDAGELDNKKVKTEKGEMNPLEMSRWLSENSEHGWLEDSIKIGTEIPLNDDEMAEFFNLCSRLTKSDIEDLKNDRPDVSFLCTPLKFNDAADKSLELEKRYKEESYIIKGWNSGSEVYKVLDEYKPKILDIITNLERISEAWEKNVLNDSVYGGSKYSFWNDTISDIRQKLENINSMNNALIEYEIDFPEDINKTAAKEDLEKLKYKLKDDKEIGWIFKKLAGKKYSYIFERVKINGLNIRRKSDIELIIKYLEKDELKRRAILRWNRTIDEVGGPQADGSSKQYYAELLDYTSRLERCLKWSEKFIAPIKKFIELLDVPGTCEWTNADWFNKVYKGIEVLELKKQYEESISFFEDLKLKIIKSGKSVNAGSSLNIFLDAAERKDKKLWKDEYNNFLRLQNLEHDYKKFEGYKSRLSAAAPRFAHAAAEKCGKGTLNVPDDLKEAWMYSELRSYLNEIKDKTNIERLEYLLKSESRIQSHIMSELVSKAAWLSQVQKITETQRRSLFAWLKAIQRIGKGTGKYANMYRKEAKREMKVCRDAIPVWIMPVQKVIENIELSDNLFDVIIVDESSQSNLFSLCTIMRAKKAVIVGDDNQISPESVGTDIGEVTKLIHRYIDGIPQSSRFEMKTSLYDMASEVFKSKVLLKEHFRCVPEIIQFSNDFMYDGKMIPLRVPMPGDVFDPPVEEIFVEDGFRDENTTKVLNRPEAEAIVEGIKKCCSDPKYDSKTIGVISLQGHDQSNLIEDLLRDAIGEPEMAQRKIICGDAYYFQGDERDIIFLSMVTAPNVRSIALTKKSDMQRFNVASTRARDQMILYHSIKLKDLNPESVRYKLLSYCENPCRVQKEMDKYDDLFESEFERDVFKIIAGRGYKVVPQVKVGTLGKRIDMVVEGMRNRLAVECDGDRWHGIDKWEEDLERQRVLERVGWVFFRIRGSVFYRDSEKALQPLWSRLDEMGIKPCED